MPVPPQPKIYHIVHVGRRPSIVADGYLWCDAEIQRLRQVGRMTGGTAIGMRTIKERRLALRLTSHPGLHVGDCVPFYFCPRSVMLFLIHRANHPKLEYQGGQAPIIHLEADLHAAVRWAEVNGRRWAFTLSNAGSRYFEDRSDLACLGEVDWDAVQACDWQHCKEGKQAEFLLEHCFPWHLIERIGVYTPVVYQQVLNALPPQGHRPAVEVRTDWYY
jgi:hypothetical protein